MRNVELLLWSRVLLDTLGTRQAARVREYVYAFTCTLAAYTKRCTLKDVQPYKDVYACTCTLAAFTKQLKVDRQTYTNSRTLKAATASAE